MKIIYASGNAPTRSKARAVLKALIMLKFIVILLVLTCLKVNASLYAQITLNATNAPIPQVLSQIEKQSGYQFFYENDLFNPASTVTVSLKNANIKAALEKCFTGLPLSYQIIDKTIVVKRKPSIIERIGNYLKDIVVTGQVTDVNGQPIAGVTVGLKNGKTLAITNADGRYSVTVAENAILVFSYVGFATQEIPVNNIATHNLTLKEAVGQLDETVIRGYGTTTQRLSTGNIAVVKAESIANQAGVTNPMQAIIGRVAGVEAQQLNGMPGSGVRIQIRGRNSINASNDPLYIVDGVPFSSTFLSVLSTASNVSPINSINPNDIESISILKDADATAIYGSRGSNGVVLITTKKGQQGKLKIDGNINNSYGTAVHLEPLMNTQEYLQYRRDAFANNGLTPTASNAPDLISWDPNANTNPQEIYFGNTAKFWDGNFSFSGGNQNLNFLLSTGLHKEGTIRSSKDDYKRGNVHLNVNYQSPDSKFKLGFNAFYSTDKYYLIFGNGSPSTVNRAIPNYPYYDANGNYNWIAGQTNYLAQGNMYWKSITNNLNANFIAAYEIIPGLYLKTSLGFNKVENEGNNVQPAKSRGPIQTAISISSFTNFNLSTALFEPQLTYNKQIEKHRIEFLAGSTMQSNKSKNGLTTVTRIINDLLLESVSGGTVASVTSNSTLYKFISLFGRASYSFDNRYLFNATFRRDGSSRFGPGKQFGNFYSLGAGWLFSNEAFLIDNAVLSYGKLRASYGTTGSDGIGDYKYLNIYATSTNYGTQPTIIPSQIANSDFQWEVNKKFETGLELGFLKDRILLNTSYFRNRSNNQLVTYPLPSITGFTGYTANLPAQVQNIGWEFEINSRNIQKTNFSWTTTANLTLPQNKLLSFPNIDQTSYANSLIIGKSLSSVLLYQFLGIDPQTGLAQVADINNNNTYESRSSYNKQDGDYIYAGYTNAKWFAGLGNTVKYKGFGLDFYFQYTRQDGYNLLNINNGFNSFGQMGNTWQALSNYWRKPGDQVSIPKPLAIPSSEISRFALSTATFSDASFLRLKSISLSYTVSPSALRVIGLNNVKFYVQGLNTFTVSNYLGYDPESASSPSVGTPVLKMWTFGLQASL